MSRGSVLETNFGGNVFPYNFPFNNQSPNQRPVGRFLENSPIALKPEISILRGLSTISDNQGGDYFNNCVFGIGRGHGRLN